MSYADAWDETAPSGASAASQLDDAIRLMKKAMRERVDDLIGLQQFATNDPVIDGSTVKSLADLTSGKLDSPSLTIGNIPKATAINAIGNSSISEAELLPVVSGANVFFSGMSSDGLLFTEALAAGTFIISVVIPGTVLSVEITSAEGALLPTSSMKQYFYNSHTTITNPNNLGSSRSIVTALVIAPTAQQLYINVTGHDITEGVVNCYLTIKRLL